MTKLPETLVKAQGAMQRSKLDIITDTLDTLNSSHKAGSSKDISDAYHFQKDILDAAYSDKGTLFSLKK